MADNFFLKFLKIDIFIFIVEILFYRKKLFSATKVAKLTV